MNQDIFYLLLKIQKEFYEDKIDKLEDRLYFIEAKKCLHECDILTASKFYTINEHYHLMRINMIERMFKCGDEKRLILTILELMYEEYNKRYDLNDTDSQNPYILAIIGPRYNRSVRKLLKSLQKYLGEDFDTYEEIMKLIKKN